VHSTVHIGGRRSQRVLRDGPLSFLWLEITGKCNLQCVHCYAESGPQVLHGRMSTRRWLEIVAEARELGAHTVQFIGGEPTLHPDFSVLVRRAAQLGLGVEVYSNLTRVRPSMWSLFEECQVSLATSFYSTDPEIHRAITLRPSHSKTLRNISEALQRQIPLRVGIIEVSPNQQVLATESMLRSMGVKNVGVDRMRSVGRAAVRLQSEPSVETLCGACGMTNAAIDPDGRVFPCVFSRWLEVGSVLASRLEQIVTGKTMTRTKDSLNGEFSLRNTPLGSLSTEPDEQSTCGPGTCNPNCAPSCMPSCNPGQGCMPNCFP
jgi:MoaA/NifB/PqqE/SkfB family radical SAM enzyme